VSHPAQPAGAGGEQKWVQVVGVEHVAADGSVSLSGAMMLMEEAAQNFLDERFGVRLSASGSGPIRVQRKVRLGERINAALSMNPVSERTVLVDVQLSVLASSGELSPFAAGKLTFEAPDGALDAPAQPDASGPDGIT
jgi:hypothetical protein